MGTETPATMGPARKATADRLAAMRDWFRKRYGSLPFNGYRIMWHTFEPALPSSRTTEGYGNG